MAGALTAAIAAAFSGGGAPTVVTDPYFEYTTLLLPGNGTNGAQNNTFLDSSTNNFTITRNGNTTQGTFSPFSQTGWGNYFSGSSQYLSVADSTAFTMGTGDFTVEYWIYWPGSGNNFRVYGQVDSGGSSASISIRGGTDASNKVINGAFSGTTDYLCTSTASLVANTWNHIAFVRDGTTLRQYINGGQDGTASISTASVNDSSNQFAIGRAGEFNGNYFGGYISNFRLVKGRCVYPSGTSFTPPTSPLTRTTGGTNPPQGTETSLLTCQSNRFLDSNGVNIPASSPLTITVNGSPSVQAFSPFNPTASWSAATNGGSGYFDGNGDYLSVADNANLRFGTSAFTIQAWIYRNASGAAHSIIAKGGASTGYVLQVTSTNVLRFTHGTTNVDTTTTIPASAWTHVAAVRTNTSTNGFQLYINGVSSATATVSTDFNQTDTLYIGSDRSAANVMNGYISGLKYTNGTAETISVPTAPPIATTNVVLLLNFTNAGIYDATSKNDLETVGNAQISTTQSKFGGSSMYFDGTGDYLYGPSNNLVNFGTGAFTIEGWVYALATPSDAGFFTNGGAATGSLGFYFLTGYLRFDIYGGGGFAATTLLPLNQWVHIACVRSGNTVTLYQNGTSVGSSTITDNNTSSLCYVGTKGWDLTKVFNGYMQDVRITKGYARYVTGTGGNAGKMVFNGTNTLALPTAASPTL